MKGFCRKTCFDIRATPVPIMVNEIGIVLGGGHLDKREKNLSIWQGTLLSQCFSKCFILLASFDY